MSQVRRLKHVAEVRFSSVDKKTVDGQIDVKLCNYTDVYYNESILADISFMDATATPDQIAAYTLRGGDVLLTKDSETADDIGVSACVPHDLPGVLCGYHLALVRPRPSAIDGRYLRWALVSTASRQQLELAATGVTRFGLRQDAVGGMNVPVPSLPEQIAIADYLDAETARIDALIGRKRALIDLMASRREAVVAAMVARSPDATPRADLPWLHAVPSRWPSVPLGLIADVFNGSTPQREEGEVGDIAWTTSGDIDQGVVTQPTAYISDNCRRAHGLTIAPAGSIVVGLVGQGRTRGLTAQLAISTTLNQNLAAICPRDDRLEPSYLGLLLGLAYHDLRNGGRGGNQAALNCEMIKAYRIPLAPRLEQIQLVDQVMVERHRDDAMTTLLTRSLDLLLERRQALVTDAVTGQLDIPGVAA